MLGTLEPIQAATGQKPGRPARGLAVLAAILSAACWGLSVVMTKALLDPMPPLTLLTIQLTASVTALWLAVLILRVRMRFDRPTRRAGLSGLLEPGFAYTIGIVGLALTTASNASLIGAAEPVLVIVLAWLFLNERIGMPMAGLATVATVGIVMVIAPNASTSLGQGSFLGDGLVLAGTFFAAVYVIATRRLVDAMPPLPLSALQQSVGLLWTLGTVAAALTAGLVALGLNGTSIPVLLLAALTGIVQYALAFWLYLFALRRLPASVAAFALALIPVFGVAAAYVFLGEGLDKMQWIGAALIVASVALASCLQED